MDSNWKPEGGGPVMILLVSLLGGAARQAHQWLGGRKVTLRHFVVRAIISLFIGVICYFMFPEHSPWSFAACGLFSWLGADGVALLLDLLFHNRKEK